MKHSNFHAKVNKVKSLEQAELKKAAEARWTIGNRLYQFLTDEEAIQLYGTLSARDK